MGSYYPLVLGEKLGVSAAMTLRNGPKTNGNLEQISPPISSWNLGVPHAILFTVDDGKCACVKIRGPGKIEWLPFVASLETPQNGCPRNTSHTQLLTAAHIV